ncbi:MAG: hypothetical protein Q7R43_02935 [Candidatus Daviesbacteria bacterium]|nr:hypothetical protein [Candidatus Daviesbacteria bacterium]
MKKLLTFQEWAQKRVAGLFVLNLILMLLVIMSVAGYFAPFFPLTINLIVLVGVVLSIFLIGMNRKTLYMFVLFFWLLAAILKTLNINIWAERSAVYAFEIFIVAFFLQIIENFIREDENKSNDLF